MKAYEQKAVKRFLVFGFNQYYPAGGWDDFEGTFDTYPEANEFAEQLKCDAVQIIELYSAEVNE